MNWCLMSMFITRRKIAYMKRLSFWVIRILPDATKRSFFPGRYTPGRTYFEFSENFCPFLSSPLLGNILVTKLRRNGDWKFSNTRHIIRKTSSSKRTFFESYLDCDKYWSDTHMHAFLGFEKFRQIDSRWPETFSFCAWYHAIFHVRCYRHYTTSECYTC